MTVRDLIRKLGQYPPDLQVVVGHPRRDYTSTTEAVFPSVEVGKVFSGGSEGWKQRTVVDDEEFLDDDDDIQEAVVIS